MTKLLLSAGLSLLLLTACAPKAPPAEEGTPSPVPAAAETPASTPESTPTATPTPALSGEEVEEARQAALDYYAGTVFEVRELTRLDPGEVPGWEGEVMFRAACSKGGQVQPERTVALERRDGVWTVINEGY